MSSTEGDESHQSLVTLPLGVVTVLILTVLLVVVLSQIAFTEVGTFDDCRQQIDQLDRHQPARWTVVETNPASGDDNPASNRSLIIEDDYELYGSNSLPPKTLPRHMVEQYIDDHMWQSGTDQRPGFYIVVDMKANQTFNRIVLDHRPEYYPDWPNNFSVAVRKTRNDPWTSVGNYTSNSLVSTANFETQTARYVKVEITSSKGYYWTVNEFFAFNVTRCGVDPGSATPENNGLSGATLTPS